MNKDFLGIDLGNIVECQAFLDDMRANLIGTEDWEKIEDLRYLKSSSPKVLSYLRSASYLALKNLRELIDGGRCTKCGSDKKLVFHHLTYKNYFCELLTDGVTLCTLCHNACHEARNLAQFLSRKEQ